MTEKHTFTLSMETLREWIAEARRYHLTITTSRGKQFLSLPLLLAAVLAILAPKLALLCLIVAYFKRARIDVIAREKRKTHDEDNTHVQAA